METQKTISEWIVSTFGDAGSNASVIARANREMSELLQAVTINDNHPELAEEAADITIILMRLCERVGADLLTEIDRKMQVNRNRKWKVANGHGYHV